MHTDETPQIEAPKSASSPDLKVIDTPLGSTLGSADSNAPNPMAASPMAPAPPAPVTEVEDDPSILVKAGTPCQRKGCGVTFVSDEVNRIGDGEGTVCTYHPAPVSRMREFLQFHFSNSPSQSSERAARCVQRIGSPSIFDIGPGISVLQTARFRVR